MRGSLEVKRRASPFWKIQSYQFISHNKVTPKKFCPSGELNATHLKHSQTPHWLQQGQTVELVQISKYSRRWMYLLKVVVEWLHFLRCPFYGKFPKFPPLIPTELIRQTPSLQYNDQSTEELRGVEFIDNNLFILESTTYYFAWQVVSYMYFNYAH